MLRSTLFILSVFLAIGVASSRVFSKDLPVNNYPIYRDDSVLEQASKDLDVTFSAGDSADDLYKNVYPMRQALSYPPIIRRPIYELNHDFERPTYYRVPEVPMRKIIYGDPYIVYPERNRKLVEFNNPHRGEVVLELRVIANNNNNEI